MSDTEEIKIGEQTLKIEVRPITIICQSAEASLGPPIKYPNRAELNTEATLYHAQRVKKLDPGFEEAWKVFHKATGKPVETVPTADEIRQMGQGSIHLMGLIDLTLKLTGFHGVPVAWIHPESFLHPGWQVGLADLAIYFSKKFNGIPQQTEEQK